MTRKDYQAWQAQMVRSAEKMSNCSRRHVACILFADRKDSRYTLAVNGSMIPKGCERPAEQGNCGCLHAEIRSAVFYSWKYPVVEAWITCAPCAPCAKALVMLQDHRQAMTVYYLEDSHPMLEGFKVLDAAGIKHVKYEGT